MNRESLCTLITIGMTAAVWVACVWMGYSLWQGIQSYRTALTDYEKAGIALDPVRALREYGTPLPDAQNAAGIYRMLADTISARAVCDEVRLLWARLAAQAPAQWSAADRSYVEGFVRTHRDVLDLLDQAAGYPACRFDLGVPRRSLPAVPDGVAFLCAAKLAMLAGLAEPQAAPRQTLAVLRLAVAQTELPLPAGTAQALETWSVALPLLQALSVRALSHTDQAALDKLLGRLALRPAAVRAFQVEMALVHAACQHYAWNPVERVHVFGLRSLLTFWADRACYLDTVRSLSVAMAQPWHMRKSAIPRPSIPRYQTLTLRLVPSLDRLDSALLVAETQVALARVALALTAFKTDRHYLPIGGLSDLIPDYLARLPDDPATNAPLSLRIAGTTAILSGAGLNGVSERGQGDDLLWEVR